MNIKIHYEEFGHGNHLLVVTLKSAIDLSALFPHPWNKLDQIEVSHPVLSCLPSTETCGAVIVCLIL